MKNTFKEKFPKLYDENSKRYRVEPVYDGGDCGSLYEVNGESINKTIFKMQMDRINTKELTEQELDCISIKKKKAMKLK